MYYNHLLPIMITTTILSSILRRKITTINALPFNPTSLNYESILSPRYHSRRSITPSSAFSQDLPFLCPSKRNTFLKQQLSRSLVRMKSTTTSTTIKLKQENIDTNTTKINLQTNTTSSTNATTKNGYTNVYTKKHNTPSNTTKTRTRQHVNPLAQKFQTPIVLDDNWVAQTFTNPDLPLFLDIGCAKGTFLLKMAADSMSSSNTDASDATGSHTREYNYLGIEIRPPVVEYALSRIPPTLKGTIHFLPCNANVNLDRILNDYAKQSNNPTPLNEVCIQFPDPHFKARHKKRRVVTSPFLQTIGKYMISDGTIFLQSDVKDVIEEMRATLREEGGLFEDIVLDGEDYGLENLYGVQTEREISVLKRDFPVYRSIFKRK